VDLRLHSWSTFSTPSRRCEWIQWTPFGLGQDEVTIGWREPAVTSRLKTHVNEKISEAIQIIVRSYASSLSPDPSVPENSRWNRKRRSPDVLGLLVLQIQNSSTKLAQPYTIKKLLDMIIYMSPSTTSHACQPAIFFENRPQ